MTMTSCTPVSAMSNSMRYARANPSHYRSARHFCTRLPEFLRGTAPYDVHPELADLAALEKALNDAFDASDERVMTLADLAVLPPEGWGELVLRPHPSVHRLDQVSNAAEIWAALFSSVNAGSERNGREATHAKVSLTNKSVNHDSAIPARLRAHILPCVAPQGAAGSRPSHLPGTCDCGALGNPAWARLREWPAARWV
jgi:hypothetical protein